jgi:iron complex outermembrane receptor protein
MFGMLLLLAEALAADETALERIVVTPEVRSPERGFVGAKSTVDLRDGRARSRSDSASVLREAAGTIVRERYNEAQDLQLSVRGFGARSTFGIRGLKLYVNGIPATGADGQAQLSNLVLDHATELVVERGPLAALYGNASGAVVRIDVNPFAAPRAQLDASLDPNQWRAGFAGSVKGERHAIAGAIAEKAYSGFRPHSGAERRQLDAIGRGRSGDFSWQWTANVLDQPRADDPLGLTRAEFDADPDSTTPNALLFDTRKTVDQSQFGGAAEWSPSDDLGVALAVHATNRDVVQFLAVPRAVQAAPTHPGGVIDLGRESTGADARAWRSFDTGAVQWTATIGAHVERLREERRGYENFVGNTLGVRGALRRDERNEADSTDGYVRVDAAFGAGIEAVAGFRSSRLDVESSDHFIAPGNPDDSGSLSYRDDGFVAGLAKQVGAWRWHVAWGEGFESPTLNELAYRGDGAAGLNTELDPARNRQTEIGVQWRHDARAAFAALTLFDADTRDEITVQSNQGGRSVFRNAGSTSRRGVEFEARTRVGDATHVAAVVNAIDATFDNGAKLPGIPERTLHLDARHDFADAFYAGATVDHLGETFVDDLNRDAAEAVTTLDAYAGKMWRFGDREVEAYARLANVFDRRYAGSVIVNEGNQRYFEPSPGRRLMVGFTINL